MNRARIGALLAAVILAGCAGGRAADHNHDAHDRDAHDHEANDHEAHDHSGHLNTFNGAPDRLITGPQGGRGQFVVECGPTHRASDDPIVFPGQPGRSHLHQFFGNTSTAAGSTPESLARADTSCDQSRDLAAYWAPALLRGEEVVEAVKSTAYYRAGPDVDPSTVVPYPPGLAMIAGNAAASGPQDPAVVAWTCGTGGQRATEPPECSPSRKLRLVVTFPDCWNGRDLDVADHIGHLAYSRAGTCPTDRPVAIPQLQFTIEYDHAGPGDQLRLASGPLWTAHADFLNAWDWDKLRAEVELCIHRDIVCGITSGRRSG